MLSSITYSPSGGVPSDSALRIINSARNATTDPFDPNVTLNITTDTFTFNIQCGEAVSLYKVGAAGVIMIPTVLPSTKIL